MFTAVGQQLDFLGGLKAVLREGRSDEDYRTAILLSITTTDGSGTEEDLRSALLSTTGADIARVIEYFPLAVVGYVNTTPNAGAGGVFEASSVAGVDSRYVLFDPDGGVGFPLGIFGLEDVETYTGELVRDFTGEIVQAFIATAAEDPLGIGGFSDESEATRRALPILIQT